MARVRVPGRPIPMVKNSIFLSDTICPWMLYGIWTMSHLDIHKDRLVLPCADRSSPLLNIWMISDSLQHNLCLIDAFLSMALLDHGYEIPLFSRQRSRLTTPSLTYTHYLRRVPGCFADGPLTETASSLMSASKFLTHACGIPESCKCCIGRGR